MIKAKEAAAARGIVSHAAFQRNPAMAPRKRMAAPKIITKNRLGLLAT